jgi:hypothetical protein
MSIDKNITVLILNTITDEVFPKIKAQGYIGNRPFFDNIDVYRRCL